MVIAEQIACFFFDYWISKDQLKHQKKADEAIALQSGFPRKGFPDNRAMTS